MHTFLLSAEDWYLVCFGVGLAFSLLTFFGGFGHLHFGHLHGGHLHLGGGENPLQGISYIFFVIDE